MRRGAKRAFWVLVGCVGCVLALVLLAVFPESPALAISARADRVIVVKHEHRMTLLRNGEVLTAYRVALGRGGEGDKVREGDNKVPEGLYLIVGRHERSAFHRALRVGYPNASQVRQAQRSGVRPGGDIMVHGIRNGLGWLRNLQRYIDWTKGCVAVTDSEMDEVWRAVPDGTPIEIRP